MIKRFVILRTESAGVHCGILLEHKDTNAVLGEARRVWRWKNANSLHELSLYGSAEEWTRISEPVDEIGLTKVIEYIPCTKVAEENLRRSRWDKSS